MTCDDFFPLCYTINGSENVDKIMSNWSIHRREGTVKAGIIATKGVENDVKRFTTHFHI